MFQNSPQENNALNAGPCHPYIRYNLFYHSMSAIHHLVPSYGAIIHQCRSDAPVLGHIL